MSVHFTTPPGQPIARDAPIVFAAGALERVSVSYAGAGEETAYRDGAFLPRFSASSYGATGVLTLRREGGWPAEVTVHVDETAAATADPYLPYSAWTSGASHLGWGDLSPIVSGEGSWMYGALVSLSAPHIGHTEFFGSKQSNYVGWGMALVEGRLISENVGLYASHSTPTNLAPDLNANLNKAYFIVSVWRNIVQPYVRTFINGTLVDSLSTGGWGSLGADTSAVSFGSTHRPNVTTSPSVRIHGAYVSKVSRTDEEVQTWAAEIKRQQRWVDPDFAPASNVSFGWMSWRLGPHTRVASSGGNATAPQPSTSIVQGIDPAIMFAW